MDHPDAGTPAGALWSERLHFRIPEPADVAEIFALDQDPETMRYLTGGRPGTWAEAAKRVSVARAWTWLATSLDDGFVGWFSLRPTGPHERELGYRIRRACWGEGYATEGARRCVDYAFTALDVHRVWAQTMTVNTGSRRVMEGAGLHYRRTFFGDWGKPIPGSEEGDVEYEMRRSDWLALRR